MPVPRRDRKGRYAKSMSLWYLVIYSCEKRRDWFAESGEGVKVGTSVWWLLPYSDVIQEHVSAKSQVATFDSNFQVSSLKTSLEMCDSSPTQGRLLRPILSPTILHDHTNSHGMLPRNQSVKRALPTAVSGSTAAVEMGAQTKI